MKTLVLGHMSKKVVRCPLKKCRFVGCVYFERANLDRKWSCQVWDGVSDARIAFSAGELLSPQPITELSRLTENLNLQRGLLHRISSLPSVELMDKVKVQSITQDGQDGSDWPLVHLSDGRVIRTRLLVGIHGIYHWST